MNRSDPKKLVVDGYNIIAERYLAWSGLRPSPQRLHYLRRLLDMLTPGASVLELGCGAGLPVTAALADRCHVTGVDISAAQLALACQHVPRVAFVQADMAALDFAPQSFDAVVSFYALTHVPRSEHAALLKRIASWLRPNGLFFATMGAGDSPDVVEDDWLGVPMFFSHFDAAPNQELVQQAGFELLFAETVTEDEDGQPATFLWVAARNMQAWR